MQTFKTVLTILIALLLQLLLSRFFNFSRYIDLPLIVAVFFGLQRSPVFGMLAGMCSGLGGDIIGWKVLGPGGISKTIIGYMLSLASVKISLDNPLVRLLILAFASALNTMMLSGLYLIVEQGPYIPGSWGMIWKVMGYKIIGDTAAGGLIYIALDRVFREQIERKRMAISPRVYE